jgi:hypothetical protein
MRSAPSKLGLHVPRAIGEAEATPRRERVTAIILDEESIMMRLMRVEVVKVGKIKQVRTAMVEGEGNG